MLDRMEDTARNGARDDAEAMLDQMQDMFENLEERTLRAVRSGRARTAQADERTRQAAARSAGAARQDFQRSQKKQRSPRASPDGGAQPQDQQEQGSEPLDQEQGDLRDRLAEMQRRLKALGLEGEKGFDDAEGDMSEAQGDLKGDGSGSAESGRPESKGGKGRGGKGDGDAVDAQGRAMQALREGAQGLQRQMQGPAANRGARSRWDGAGSAISPAAIRWDAAPTASAARARASCTKARPPPSAHAACCKSSAAASPIPTDRPTSGIIWSGCSGTIEEEKARPDRAPIDVLDARFSRA